MFIGYRWSMVCCVVLLAACATPKKSALHESLAKSPDQTLPRKVLLLPVDIRLHEVSTGGVTEKVDEWSNTASTRAAQCVREEANSRHLFEIVEGPPLSPEDKAALDQYIALYDVVAGSAYVASHSVYPAWTERAKTFDYTLGPGLKDLAEHTGIDAALLVSGSDYISSSGRRAAMAMGALLGAFTGVVVMPAGGISFISVGVIDLRSGNVIWFGTDQSGGTDFRNEADIRRMLDGLFQTYPGATQAKTANAK
jgi:hypothetical protein